METQTIVCRFILCSEKKKKGMSRPTTTTTLLCSNTFRKCRTKGLRDGDVPDNGDERYDQNAELEVLHHVDEVFGSIASCSRDRGRLDARQTGIDVTRENERRSITVRLEDVGCNRANNNHESVPGRTDHPEKSSQRQLSGAYLIFPRAFSVLQVLEK